MLRFSILKSGVGLLFLALAGSCPAQNTPSVTVNPLGFDLDAGAPIRIQGTARGVGSPLARVTVKHDNDVVFDRSVGSVPGVDLGTLGIQFPAKEGHHQITVIATGANRQQGGAGANYQAHKTGGPLKITLPSNKVKVPPGDANAALLNAILEPGAGQVKFKISLNGQQVFAKGPMGQAGVPINLGLFNFRSPAAVRVGANTLTVEATDRKGASTSASTTIEGVPASGGGGAPPSVDPRRVTLEPIGTVTAGKKLTLRGTIVNPLGKTGIQIIHAGRTVLSGEVRGTRVAIESLLAASGGITALEGSHTVQVGFIGLIGNAPPPPAASQTYVGVRAAADGGAGGGGGTGGAGGGGGGGLNLGPRVQLDTPQNVRVGVAFRIGGVATAPRGLRDITIDVDGLNPRKFVVRGTSLQIQQLGFQPVVAGAGPHRLRATVTDVAGASNATVVNFFANVR